MLYLQKMVNLYNMLNICQMLHVNNVSVEKKNYFQLPVDCQLKLFDQTITPILLYGSEITYCLSFYFTGFENLYALEKVHLGFLRSVLKMKNSTPLNMIYGEFGRFPLEIQAKTRMIKFWSKILNGKKQ